MNIVIFGATSAIAQAWARLHAAQGASFYLLGRDVGKLKTVKNDLLTRGASQVQLYTADLAQVQDYSVIADEIYAYWPQIDIALFAQGSLPDQRQLEKNIAAVRAMFELYFTSQCDC